MNANNWISSQQDNDTIDVSHCSINYSFTSNTVISRNQDAYNLLISFCRKIDAYLNFHEIYVHHFDKNEET